MNIKELCEKIEIQEEVANRTLTTCYREYEGFADRFCNTGDYEAVYGEWTDLYGKNDVDGLLTLGVMLCGACKSYENYKNKGISQKIFIDTMKCFSRFCNEFYETHGRYGFDRGFWTGRQLSMRLFRIGCLEYELCESDGKKEIAIHIPSDADLSVETVKHSLSEANVFMNEYYPEYADADRHCVSWLLSPSLFELLPSKSNIRNFALLFQIKDVDQEDESYKLWLFKNDKIQIKDVPQNTSLQRAVKRFVLAGGKIGAAHGVLIK